MIKWLKKTALWIVAVPLLCLLSGIASNQLVLVANHDRFPVMWNDMKVAQYATEIEKAGEECQAAVESGDAPPDACEPIALAAEGLEHGYLDDTHVLMTKNTHLNFLADWIDFKTATYSPGDELIDLGEFGLKYAPIIWITVVIGRLRKREDYY